MASRVVRVFISSTFRDFAEERDLLASRVFPELRRRSRGRFVEVIGIDLRWGITEAESQTGQTLPICLREIDRARPYFIGLLGERYGWTPKANQFPSTLVEEQEWLVEHAGGKSVTELEVLHGVLNNPAMAGRIHFYFRDPQWSEGRGPDFRSEGDGEREKLALLKQRLRSSSFPVSDYATPEAAAALITDHLWQLIEAEYPVDGVLNELEREQFAHTAFAANRRQVHAGREEPLADVCKRIANLESASAGRLLVLCGKEGVGKTSLLVQAVAAHRTARPDDLVFEHYAGCSPQAVDLFLLLRRLGSFCVGDTVAKASYSELVRAVPDWLAVLSSRLENESRQALLVFDGVDQLIGPSHVPWLPAFIPRRITVVASVAEGAVIDVLAPRADDVFVCEEIPPDDRTNILTGLLSRQGKRLGPADSARIVGHPKAGMPAFLNAVVHDLCVSASHENLPQRIDEILQSDDLDDVLERTLARTEQELGRDTVQSVLEALATSRAGLTTDELFQRCSLTPLSWARLEAALGPMVAQFSSTIAIAGGYASRAIQNRYSLHGESLQALHGIAADWWLNRGPSERAVFDLPYQLAAAGRPEDLRRLLLNRAWIESLLGHCTEAELQDHWLATPLGTSATLADDYRSSLNDWEKDGSTPLEGGMLMRLGGFISYASGPSDLSLLLLEHAVESGRKTSCPESDLALFLNNLGHEQLLLGRVEESLRSFSESLDIRRRCLPDGHPHTLGTLDNLGQAYTAAGRREDAICYLRAALKMRSRQLGEHDPETATSRNNLAMTLAAGECSDSELREVERLLEDAYSISIHTLGARHPDTAISAGNLGFYHARHGDEQKARSLMELALAIHEEKFGREHEYVAVGRARLADFEIRQGVRAREEGRLEDARAILLAEMERRIKLHGDRSLQWAAAASALAETLGRLGEIAEAQNLFRLTLEVRKDALGPDHELTQIVATRLAAIS